MPPFTVIFQYCRYFASPESGDIVGRGGSTVYKNRTSLSNKLFSLSAGAGKCVACNAGSISAGEGGVECTACTAGRSLVAILRLLFY